MNLVLYIDDSRVALKMMALKLKNFVDLKCTQNISGALKLIKEFHFDAFIIDCQLVSEHGFDLVEILRRDGYLQRNSHYYNFCQLD